MDMHECPVCGLTHGAAGERPESDEVKIARLQAERDMEIARVNARTERDYNETREEVAHIEADGEVAVAEALAPAIAEAATDDEPEAEPIPVVVEDGEPETEPEPELPDVPPPPAADDIVPEVSKKPTGMWAGYR